MSSLTLWKARTLVLHGFLLSVDALLWMATAFLFVLAHKTWIATPEARSLSLLALALVVTFLIRMRRLWSHRQLFSIMEKNRAHGTPSPFLLEDVLNKHGHFPNHEKYQELQKHLSESPFPSYPYSLFSSHILRGLLWPAIISISILATNQLPHPSPAKGPLIITLTPPDYLELPSRIIDPREESIQVYPGTLIRIEGLTRSSSLKDNQNRSYLSRRGSQGHSFEARILSPLILQLSEPDHQLKIQTLADLPPTLTWIRTPINLEFRPHSIAFKASDDHGLQESLVTVNGQEIEYAGDSQGLPTFSYRWDFDPSIHRPLLGGNVSLQISAYDNDRVGGPKRSQSPPIIWSFPGVQHLAQKTLELIKTTRKNTSRRLDPKEPLPAQALLKDIMEMSPLLRDNPAMPPALLGLNRSMALQMSSQARKDQGQPSAQEEKLHQQHEWTLGMIEQQAQQILDTIEASKWVQRLQDTAEKAKREDVSQKDWNELYEELRDHLEKTDTHPGFREEMMAKLNQAELASQMGDPETSSQLLDEMAEQMREQPSAMGASGPNPLAEKFQALMEELKALISLQGENITTLNHSQQHIQKLQGFRMSLMNHPNMKAHQDWRVKMSKLLGRGDKIPDDLKEKDRRPGDPVAIGKSLHQLYGDLSRILSNQSPRAPWPKPEALPADLQQAWRNLIPSLGKIPEKPYPPKTISTQIELTSRGKEFKEDFENNIASFLPGPFLGPLAQQGENYSRQALLRMKAQQRLPLVQQDMKAASSSWKALLQQLQQLQQAAQQAAGRQQQALKIGKNGQLQLSNQGQPQEEGDGRFEQKDQDIEIPLPEDFQSNRAIEERLQESLRKTRNEEEMSRFKDYMLDLLE